VDWRIQEALLYAIGSLRDQIWKYQEMRVQMEKILMDYVAPALKSEQAMVRARACQLYGIYRFKKTLKNEDHVRQVVDSLITNMVEDQPLPVRFQAACALEKILKN